MAARELVLIVDYGSQYTQLIARRVREAGREGQRDLKGSIDLQRGEIVGASVLASGGLRVVGEKALYRLLGWGEGRFEFTPGEVETSHPLGRHTRALLLEGIRQLDEWERLKPELPPLDRYKDKL